MVVVLKGLISIHKVVCSGACGLSLQHVSFHHENTRIFVSTREAMAVIFTANLSIRLSNFFSKFELQIGGAAYLRVRLIHGTLRYINRLFPMFTSRNDPYLPHGRDFSKGPLPHLS